MIPKYKLDITIKRYILSYLQLFNLILINVRVLKTIIFEFPVF